MGLRGVSVSVGGTRRVVVVEGKYDELPSTHHRCGRFEPRSVQYARVRTPGIADAGGVGDTLGELDQNDEREVVAVNLRDTEDTDPGLADLRELTILKHLNPIRSQDMV